MAENKFVDALVGFAGRALAGAADAALEEVQNGLAQVDAHISGARKRARKRRERPAAKVIDVNFVEAKRR